MAKLLVASIDDVVPKCFRNAVHAKYAGDGRTGINIGQVRQSERWPAVSR